MKWWCVLCLALASGCSRAHYRHDADCEASGTLYSKTYCTPWQPPDDFSIEPDPQSRLFDPYDPDRPSLPFAQPQLYSYQLPPSTRFVPPPPAPAGDSDFQAEPDEPQSVVTADATAPAADEQGVRPVSFSRSAEGRKPSQLAAKSRHVAIPPSAWESLPPKCLTLILEFSSVREEHASTKEYCTEQGLEPPPYLQDDSRELTLEEVVELGLLNSREYQTQKETLYRSALALTLERFDYDLKFLSTGNGADVNYEHSRSAGQTVNRLGIPSSFGMNKVLATSGTLLARFANRVVLTFNGPDGFASEVGSDLLFQITQTAFQRDILLEPLVQAERNVVYAARSFARFRKRFFFQRTSEYYSLLLNYREIEIDAQNYFSLVRAWNQAEAEELEGFQSRIQVEQIEQKMLQGRSALITTCNSLQSRLDNLKISLGLPTELPVSLDLNELGQITLRDETQVAAEQVRRARRRLESLSQRERPVRADLLNAAIILAQRLVKWLQLREQQTQEDSPVASLEELEARLSVDQGRLQVDPEREEFHEARDADPPAHPILLFQRTMDLIGASLELATRQMHLADTLHADPNETAALKERLDAAYTQAWGRPERTNGPSDKGVPGLPDKFASASAKAEREKFPVLQKEAEDLLDEIDKIVGAADRLTGAPAKPLDPEQQMAETIQRGKELIEQSDRLLQTAEVGLVPVEISVDDAMLTALSQRLDLMNERGRVADDLRAVKFAADDLKSVLNLRAIQTISTSRNRPFGFTFDESLTEIGLSLDLPLNRKAQRNDYRTTLIDYQVALRGLMQLEDQIKFDIREDLRDLALARVQYLISVASAALAAERVRSTRLELDLGFPGVAARDFLEAQDAYRSALSGVAGNHIGYLEDRAGFFFNLELMQLDESGFWPQLYDAHFQPIPSYELPPEAGPAYGELPEFLKLSRDIRQSLYHGNWCRPVE